MHVRCGVSHCLLQDARALQEVNRAAEAWWKLVEYFLPTIAFSISMSKQTLAHGC